VPTVCILLADCLVKSDIIDCLERLCWRSGMNRQSGYIEEALAANVLKPAARLCPWSKTFTHGQSRFWPRLQTVCLRMCGTLNHPVGTRLIHTSANTGLWIIPNKRLFNHQDPTQNQYLPRSSNLSFWCWVSKFWSNHIGNCAWQLITSYHVSNMSSARKEQEDALEYGL